MKAVNMMNFVRQIDERKKNSTENMYDFTNAELDLVNEYGIENTFLLQYDVLCDETFVSLFKEKAGENTELGLWYEIVEPMTTACGIPYKSENGWKWDWHIIPGYSMGYLPADRERLIDESMRKFKEVFGYYPKTVAGWVIDTHTLNYLQDHYDISAAAICRDETSTDAYTLVGGYFNQAYYPSRNNIFTPAQHMEMQNDIPVFRLLGPCPIHNYDHKKYSSEELINTWTNAPTVFTLEPASNLGKSPEAVKWIFDSYYTEESLGFSYAQLGQENSFYFWKDELLNTLRMQVDLLLARGDVKFMKMKDTGEAFKKLYPNLTPPTSVVASNNFDTADVQSVYYDCKNYTANLFRFEDKIFLRSLYLFDERVKDIYADKVCDTFDAVYENLPIIDTAAIPVEYRKESGLMIDTDGKPFVTKKIADGVLEVSFGDNYVIFREDRIEIKADKLTIYSNSAKALDSITENRVTFNYKGTQYNVQFEGGTARKSGENTEITSTNGVVVLHIHA